MSTLSVPLTPQLEEFINRQVKEGKAPNKAAVVRRAVIKLSEDEAVNEVLRAEQEVREGKVIEVKGDIRQILRHDEKQTQFCFHSVSSGEFKASLSTPNS